MNLVEIAKLDENGAREYLESLRWPDGPVCPHCKSQRVTRLHGEKHRPGTIQCNDCREQFTVTVGSVMESSHIPLNKWVMAYHLLCSSKKGMSAKQLQRDLGLGSYHSAWFMCHRIRHAMAGEPMKELMKGTVEVDETYVGGKPRKANKSSQSDGSTETTEGAKRGRGTDKTPVVALVGRAGGVHAEPVEFVDSDTLKGEIRKRVDVSAKIVTDGFVSYRGLETEFAGGHETVNHTDGEYVRYTEGDAIHTNTVESFFALMKRGHYGVYHMMSKKHLHRYCAEFSFRWDHRKVKDGERRDAAIRRAEGKRLTYR